MIFIVIAMIVALVAAGAVLAYVTWPHRGEDMPYVPAVGTSMRKAVASMPTLSEPADAYEPAGR